MSVGTGSIKRAAAKATETPKQTEAAEQDAVLAGQKTEAAVPEEKKAAKKAESEKASAAKKPRAAKSKAVPKEAEPEREEAAVNTKSGNQVCQLTEEMPVYLL